VAGPDGKACRFSLEYPELRSADPKLERAVNQRLAPARADFHCTADDVEWSGDNGLSGTGQPAPRVFERTGAYEVLFNDQQLLAVQLTLSADVGMAHGIMLRDDVLVLDLARAGRVVPLSEVVDRSSHPEAWLSRVQAAMNRALAPDLSVAEWVTNLTVDLDRYALSSAGITLCPNGLPSALAALESCSYTVFWAELSPLWVAGNPLERVRRAAGPPTTRQTLP